MKWERDAKFEWIKKVLKGAKEATPDLIGVHFFSKNGVILAITASDVNCFNEQMMS